MYFQIYDKNGNRVNTIVANQSFIENYCKTFGLTYKQVEEEKPVVIEPIPTTDERIATLKQENKLLTQQVDALSSQNDFQEELIVELANIVYA